MPDWISGALEYVMDFSRVLNTSVSASWLVLIVVVLRLLLRKAPKWISVVLWGLVAVRLIMPFSVESMFSLLPSAEVVSDSLLQAGPGPGAQPAYLELVKNPTYGTGLTVELRQNISSFQWKLLDLTWIWLIGMAVMAAYAAVSYWRLRQMIRTAVRYRDNIYQSENVKSPFVLGLIKPKIYLPFQMEEQDMKYVVSHEQAHIRRKDHWWKPLGFLLLSVHWFNPLMWLAYVLLCRDIELACDEKVIKRLDNGQRADYSLALVACSVDRRMIAACPLAFGEVGVKERVKSVMYYKKPAFWIVVCGLTACMLAAVCFLTDPIPAGDAIVCVSSDSPADAHGVSYSVDLGHEAMSGEIYVEQWIKGECVRSAPVVMTQYVDSVDITMQTRREEYTAVGTEVQIETNQYGGSLLTYFPRPAELDVTAWTFTGHERDRKVSVSPDEEVILAAMGFECGNGIWVFDCESLITEPERLETADYMIVVRAIFSADPLGVTCHEELTPPKEVLSLNDVIILSQKGYDLTWSDFEPYDYTETGSGLYIRVYPINEWYELWIGGSGPDSAPMYLYLTVSDNHDMRIDIRDGGVTEFLQWVRDSKPAEPKEWIPTDTSLHGLHAGALLVPIDGKTYRYALTDAAPEDAAADQVLDRFTEEDHGKDIEWTVCSLKEYPDHSTVLLLSRTHGAWLCQYSPPGKCADTALGNAVESGYVIMEDGIATHGQEHWDAFYEAAQQGNAATVTVAQYHTLNPETCDAAYYEVFQQDYPSMSLYELTYDGASYQVAIQSGGGTSYRVFAYLMKYDTTNFSTVSAQKPDTTIRYVLTHDHTVTWEQLFHGMASSAYGAYIDHVSVYAAKE